MSESWLDEEFEANRARLRSVAFRMLGSPEEADDAVQETWLRVQRAAAGDIENMGGWLTTIVSRICLDILRARTAKREDPVGDRLPEPHVAPDAPGTPEGDALLADSLGPALLIVLETLSPAERLAFVLHDMFGVPFEQIATIVGRSPAATRQLASRARRRVQGAEQAERPSPGVAAASRRRSIVEAFLAASREGNFDRLVELLDPDVVLRADSVAVTIGATAMVRGATDVAQTFAGRAAAARIATIDGRPGAVWAQGGTPRVVFEFAISGVRITAISLIADPAAIGDLELSYGARGA
jgi:RNA polymerase sigma-70 factor (ECF subfamily)